LKIPAERNGNKRKLKATVFPANFGLSEAIGINVKATEVFAL
jgi:hypothetical protein